MTDLNPTTPPWFRQGSVRIVVPDPEALPQIAAVGTTAIVRTMRPGVGRPPMRPSTPPAPSAARSRRAAERVRPSPDEQTIWRMEPGGWVQVT